MTRRTGAPGGRAVSRPYVEPGVLPPEDFGRPVFELDRRLRAVERAFYRHVLRVIDLDALFDLEQQLWSRLQDQGQLTDDQVLDLSNAIIERALERVGRDPTRAVRVGVIGPGGGIIPAPEEPHERCPFCDGDGDGDGGPDDGDDGAAATAARMTATAEDGGAGAVDRPPQHVPAPEARP